jgi:AcrR family transcriptional regulator
VPSDAMPAKRSELATWRREQIIDSAMSVFGGKGVDAASMKDVAMAAGVTQGLLYHYFAGKEALVVAVIAERGFLPELRRLLSAAADRPASEVLPEVVAGFDKLLTARTPLLGMFLSGAHGNPKIRAGLEAVIAEGQRLLGEYLTARVAAGELHEHEPSAVAQMLLCSSLVTAVMGLSSDPRAKTSILIHGLAAT